MNTTNEIREIFQSEFRFLADRFDIFELPLSDARSSEDPNINMPGVYVHWSPSLGPVKVGKSQKNSRKRAMEHIRDNTHNKDRSYGMARLLDEPGAILLLFNVSSQENVHWLLSLEYFLEKRLRPFVRSDRSG